MAQRNLITDVAGVLVGHADDARLASGVTVIVFEEPAVAAVDVRGGAPGTRETDLLEPHRTAERIDAVVLSGGSAFGLDAGAGVQAFLRERGRSGAHQHRRCCPHCQLAPHPGDDYGSEFANWRRFLRA